MEHQKYPSTPYLIDSASLDRADTVTNGIDADVVVVTEKMDGEGTTFYRDGYHARSLDSRFHPSRSWVAALHGSIAHTIADGMKICGENLYAEHSIRYDKLPTYFMVYNIWIDDTCLSWRDTVEWCSLLGLETVPVMYIGPNYSGMDWELHWKNHQDRIGRDVEGFVIRDAGEFKLADWDKKIGKWVRPHHVQTDEHWMHKEVVPNGLDRVR